jgi:hypothetical protein
MRLGILLTNRCNAHCDHCAPDSGPLDTTELSLEEIFSSITQAAQVVPTHRHLGLSGGEVFLHYPRLLKIVEFARQQGFEVTITSNAFWARTLDAAREKLKPLCDLGLSVLAVSRSQFHERYIPLSRLRNVLLAATEFGLQVHLKVIVTRSYPLSRLLSGLDDVIATSAARVEPIPCYPFGRARELVPESELYLRPGIPMLPCPGASFTITPSGEARPCCNPGSEGDLLLLGDTRKESLAGLYRKFARGPLMRVIYEHGPGYFVPAIQERGLGHKLPQAYVGVCHLCGLIAEDPELAAVAREVAQHEEEKRSQEKLARYLTAYETAYAAASLVGVQPEKEGVR